MSDIYHATITTVAGTTHIYDTRPPHNNKSSHSARRILKLDEGVRVTLVDGCMRLYPWTSIVVLEFEVYAPPSDRRSALEQGGA